MKHMKQQAPLNFAFYTKKQMLYSRRSTFILIGSAVLIFSMLCILHARQLVTLYTLKQEYTTLKQYTEEQKQKVAQKKTLTKKQATLHKKLTLFTTHAQTVLTLLLKQLSHALPDTVRIDTLETDFTQKTSIIIGHALNSEGVTTLVRTLSHKPPFKTVTLTGVDKHPHHLYCTFNLHTTF
jgi:Tfp pilus assembly protein PilN